MLQEQREGSPLEAARKRVQESARGFKRQLPMRDYWRAVVLAQRELKEPEAR